MARNLFTWGFEWQSGQFKAHGSRMTTYVRGYDSIDIVGMPGNRRSQATQADGSMKIEFSDLSITYKLDDFTFDGLNPIEPERGDYIYVERKDGSAVDIFAVLPLGYEGTHRIDPDRTRITVHTKLDRTEEYYA